MQGRYDQLSPVPPLTPVAKTLVISCVVIFVIDVLFRKLGVMINGHDLTDLLGLVPMRLRDDHWYWQLATYAFMHGHPLHLLLNMLLLWYFGSEIEMRIGGRKFLFYFLLCAIGAGAFNAGVNFWMGTKLNNAVIGSSGAVYGILAAYALFFPDRIFLVFMLFPIKAKYYTLIIVLLEMYFAQMANPGDNISHLAHLGGFFVGGLYIYFRYIKTWGGGSGHGSRRDAERERLKRQFTLIVNDSNNNKKDEEGDGGSGPYWN